VATTRSGTHPAVTFGPCLMRASSPYFRTVHWARGECRFRTFGLIVVLAVLGCSAASASVGVSVAKGANAQTYIALGDSVAAGEGLPPLNPCHRSQLAYPSLLAADPQAFSTAPTFIDLACTGASTDNLLNVQQTVNGATEPPQLSQVGDTSADVVTITAGLDDVPNWGGRMVQCLVAGSACGVFQSQAINRVAAQAKANLEVIISRVQSMPTHPRIIVTGYYNPFNDFAPPVPDGSCDLASYATLSAAYLNGTVASLQDFEQRINAAIQQAAEGDNVSYVDIWNAFPEDERMCFASNSVFPMDVNRSKTDKPQFHPTAQGQAQIEPLVRAALVSAPPAAPQTLISSVGIDPGQVNAVATSGSTAYIAGDFDRVGHSTGGGFAASTSSSAAQVEGAVDGTVNATVPDGAGGWYIGGDFTAVGGVRRTSLAHLLADGSLDTGFNPRLSENASGPPTVNAITLANGSVFFGGSFDGVDGTPVEELAAVDQQTGGSVTWQGADGSDFGTQHFEMASDNGLVYIGGEFSRIDGVARNALAAVDPATGSVTAWNPGAGPLTPSVQALAADGPNILVGGDFNQLGGQPRDGLAMIDPNGTATGWAPTLGAPASVTALTLRGTTVYFAGAFGTVDGQPRNGLAAAGPSGSVTAWAPGAVSGSCESGGRGTTLVTSLASTSAGIAIGGNFASVDGQPRNCLAMVKTTGSVSTWNPNPDDPVDAVATDGSSRLYAGGLFALAGNWVERPRGLAAVNLTTGDITNWNPQATQGNAPSTIAVGNGLVYAAGGGYAPNAVLSAFSRTTGALTSWSPSLSGSSGVDVFALAAAGGSVYIGGIFDTVDGNAMSNLAKVDGTTGAVSPWTPNPDGEVTALSVSGSTLYVGGNISTIAGATRSALAAVNTSTGAASPLNPLMRTNCFCERLVNSIAHAKGAVFAVGDFDEVADGSNDGLTRIGRHYLAALAPTTGFTATGWPAMCPAGATNAFVAATSTTVSKTTMYVGGTFTNFAFNDDENESGCANEYFGDPALPRSGIAAFNLSNGVITPFAPTIDGPIVALGDSGTTLIVAGAFDSVDGNPHEGLAIFHGA
jgi:hypothetical protein